jgi:acetyl esterase/lipase
MNLAYRNDHGRTEHLDLYLPGGPAPPGGFPAILALPGGGWRWVRRSDLGVTVSSLAQYGYVVAVADYAFASSTPGTHVWPTDFEDVQQAVRWLRTNAGRFGINPNRIAAWGESAGGHLASLLGTDPNGPAGSLPNPVSARVEAVIDFYGPSDLTLLYQENPRVRPYLETFLGGSPAQVPASYADASPDNHVTRDAPPFLIFQGTADNANLPDQSSRLSLLLQMAGVPHHTEWFVGLPHGFRLRPGSGVNLLPEVLSFLDAALNHHGEGIA